jgi:nicotinamidase-related amidase
MTPHRFSHRGGALLIVDLQEKLVVRIPRSAGVVAQCVRLVQGAKLLDIPVWATEQYPKGLGSTVAVVADLIPHRPAKMTFHCCSVGEIVEHLHGRSIKHVTLAGLETHVCIAQTAIELLRMNFAVQVPADAVASRGEFDTKIALRRMENAGAVITTSEAVLFEWIETADHPKFKELSGLVKSFEA